MTMGKLEGAVELANLAASVIQLMRGHPGGGGGATAGGIGGLARAIGRLATSLGLTKFDETALAGVVARLTPEEFRKWTMVQKKLNDEEREFLRIVIALMEENEPAAMGAEKALPDKGGSDVRLEFVRGLAGMVPEGAAADEAAEEVAQLLRENNLAGSGRSFERFRKIRNWLERFSEISEELVRLKLGEWSEKKEPEPRGILERLVGLAIIGPKAPSKPIA